MSGLLNYYGRTPESDNILIKPVLLQKGNSKLALYGMSNVRDERLFRTFRDGNVKFFQPGTQKDDWFNLMSVHQNHHAYTDTGYLPENFLPTFLDLVVWGHEHECKIDPITNTETGFRVMQPGSSVATSLVPGEAVTKQVAILSITGKDMQVETIRLKTVRPFVYKEIALSDSKALRDVAYDHENRAKVSRHLVETVEAMIEEANKSWLEAQQESGDELDEDAVPPLPVIRLRVEYTAPEGGNFEIDNPQRFSSRFVGRLANVTDVVQFHRKRVAAPRKAKNEAEMPTEEAMSRVNLESVKVGKLVEEFLTAQSLTILPQVNFSDAVTQFVDKDDKYAMSEFVEESLKTLVSQVINDGEGGENDDREPDDEAMFEVIEREKAKMEQQHVNGEGKKMRRKGRKPKPAEWDSEDNGHWEDNIASIIRSDDEAERDEDDDSDDAESVSARPAAGRGRGRGRGGARGGKAAAGTTRKTAAATKKAPAKSTGGRGKKKQVVSDDEDEEDSDLVMLDDDEDDDEEDLFVRPAKKAPATKTRAAPKASSTAAKSTRGGKASGTQSKLPFASQQTNGTQSRSTTSGRAAAPKRLQEPSEDEISDDDDAFEPPPPSARITKGRR